MLSMVTLALLWLLQTVFLQSFYDWMQLENVKRAAGEIAENMEKEGDYHIVDRIAYENSMQVILTDMDGNILCRVDEYSPAYAQEQESQEEETKKAELADREVPEFAKRLRLIFAGAFGKPWRVRFVYACHRDRRQPFSIWKAHSLWG